MNTPDTKAATSQGTAPAATASAADAPPATTPPTADTAQVKDMTAADLAAILKRKPVSSDPPQNLPPAEPPQEPAPTEPTGTDDQSGDQGTDRVQQRIDALVAQKSELQAKVQALEARLNATAPAQPATPPEPPPLTPAQKSQQALELLRIAEEHPEGGEIKLGDRTVTLTQEQIIALRLKATEQLTEAKAEALFAANQAKQDTRSEVDRHFEAAVQRYPALKDDGSPMMAAARQIATEKPHLLTSPDWPEVVADLAHARLARTKPGSAPAVAKATPQPGIPRTVAPAAAPVSKAREGFAAGRDRRTFAQLLASHRP